MTAQVPRFLNPGDGRCFVGHAVVTMMQDEANSQLTAEFQNETAKLTHTHPQKQKQKQTTKKTLQPNTIPYLQKVKSRETNVETLET